MNSPKRTGKLNPFYGKHHTEKTKEKIRNSNYHRNLEGKNNGMYGRKNSWGKHTEEAKSNISKNNCNNKIEVRKKKSKAMMGNKHFMFGKKQPEIFNKKRRITTLKNIQKLGGIKIGMNETRILDELELSLNKKIIRQYEICGYSVDGYIPKLNLVIEVDEKGHFDIDRNLKQKDIIRQNNIQKELNCDFVRIGDI